MFPRSCMRYSTPSSCNRISSIWGVSLPCVLPLGKSFRSIRPCPLKTLIPVTCFFLVPVMSYALLQAYCNIIRQRRPLLKFPEPSLFSAAGCPMLLRHYLFEREQIAPLEGHEDALLPSMQHCRITRCAVHGAEPDQNEYWPFLRKVFQQAFCITIPASQP